MIFSLTIFDLLLLLVIAGFVFYGLFFGLIRTIGSLLGFIGGLYLAVLYYDKLYGYAKDLSFGYENLGKIVSFLIIFILVNRLICFLFSLLSKGLDIISFIPFIKTIDKLGGAILGFLEGAIILGLLFYVLSIYKMPILSDFFLSFIKSSKIAPSLIKFNNIILPLLPGLIEKIKNILLNQNNSPTSGIKLYGK